ncbi:MAG: transposase [Patescibacteria group bacterium]|nr:transposase [Patescibacteria group bacterium]
MYKNSQKRIYIENAIYFVTTKTKDNYPYFRNEILTGLFINRLSIAEQSMRFRLFGFVVIPDHVHILIQPSGKYNISKIMFTIKKQFSHEVNRLIGVNSRIATTVGEQALVRLRRFVITHKIYIRKFGWLKSYHDHIILNDKDFNRHVEYLRLNPIKHGLVKEGEYYPYLYINEKLIHEIFE